MFLSVKRSGNAVRVYLLEAVYENGKKKNKVIKSFGRRDQISDEDFAQLQEKYGQAQNRLAAKQAAYADELEKLIDRIHAVQEEESGGSPEAWAWPILHYGHLLLSNLWEKELNLGYKLNYEQRTATKISAYKINDVAFYLAALKLIDPYSHLAAYENQTAFLFNPIEGIALDNIYAALDFLGNNKELIMEFVGKRLLKRRQSEPRMLFYDCTNCYFETPFDDREQFIRKFTHDYRKKLRKKGYGPDAVRKELEGELFKAELDKALDEAEEDFYRMRGLSKEHRYDLPLVSVALVIDDDGMPLDFQVYEGNSSEYRRMPESVQKLKDKYGVKDTCIVADRGLNSTENLKMLLDNDLGFIVAQKVSYQNKTVREEMLNETGWKNYRPMRGEDGKIHSITAESEELGPFRYKICSFKKSSRIKDPDNPNKTKVISIDCRVMYTFSEKRRDRDLMQLDEDLKKAQAAIDNGSLMGRFGGSGWRRLVQTAAEKDESNKEIYRAEGLKEAVIEERRQIAGYAAAVFSPSPRQLAAGEEIDPAELLDSYQKLVRIESCFRVMKNNFSIRPMYVRLGRRIIGHCLLCVLALCMLRMIEQALEKSGCRLSVDEITEALYNAFVMAVKMPGAKDRLYLSGRLYNDIYTRVTTGKGRRQADENETVDSEEVLKRYKEINENGSALNQLITSLGYKPLPQIVTAKELATCLGRKFGDRDAVSRAVSGLLGF